jgi:hypothetical protein
MSRLALAAVLLLAVGGFAQVIEFESGGLRYQTLTKNGITIMFAHLPSQVREYSIIQVAVTNGSSAPWVVRPEDFRFELPNGTTIRAVPALQVINELIRHASGDDVIKLVTTYELGLYGINRIHSTNGYEKRRQSALAVVSSARLKAAAAASAIALVETRLAPGESTDGAVFYPTAGRPIGESRLKVYTAGQVFEFEASTPQWASK